MRLRLVCRLMLVWFRVVCSVLVSDRFSICLFMVSIWLGCRLWVI